MARASNKISAKIGSERGESPPEEEKTEREEAALDAITEAFSADEGEHEWSVRVNRIKGTTRSGLKEPWLFDCGYEELVNLRERLAWEYGEGQYRCRVRRDGKQFKQYDIEIELSTAERRAFFVRNPRASSEGAPLPENVPAPAVSQPNSEIARLADAINQQGQLLRALVERITQPQQAPDSMATFEKMLDAFGKFQTALPRHEQQTGLDMFQKGMEFAGKIAGGGEGHETNLLDLAREILGSPATAKVVDRILSPAAAPHSEIAPQYGYGRPLSPPSLPPNRVSTPPGPPAGGANPDSDLAIAWLIDHAKNGTQPELVASQALSMIPPATLDILEQQEDVVGFLISRFPQIAPYRTWFEAVVENMWEPEETTAPNIRSPGNAPANGAPQP
jgi:hypothetical protein